MVHKSSGRRLLVSLLACQLFLAVHTHSLSAAEESDQPPTATAATTAVPADEEGHEGLAAYYASRYNKRRTNSGERYDPKKLTAAHAHLPLGSRVKVVNLANQREVVVTINDRCRKRKTPFIDLSREAARQLGFLGKGTARVRIIPLEESS
ncbi:MAG TPA: septal ring lytic transglycosylase RlpA family protein [Geobacteraceae bacterium]